MQILPCRHHQRFQFDRSLAPIHCRNHTLNINALTLRLLLLGLLRTLLGLLWRGAIGTWLTLLLIVALSLAGVAAALWQHFVAAASDSCNRTLAEKIISGLGLDGSLPEIFQPPAASTRMPLWRPYLRYLTSGIADLANGSSSTMAGSVTAALYEYSSTSGASYNTIGTKTIVIAPPAAPVITISSAGYSLNSRADGSFRLVRDGSVSTGVACTPIPGNLPWLGVAAGKVAICGPG